MPHRPPSRGPPRRQRRRPAAMVVHALAGYPADGAGWPPRPGIRSTVVEDAAHALGATGAGGRSAPSPARLLQLLRHQEPADRRGRHGHHRRRRPRRRWIRRARLHGMSARRLAPLPPGRHWRYDVEEAGLKANLTDLQAAIGRAQLRQLPAGRHAGARARGAVRRAARRPPRRRRLHRPAPDGPARLAPVRGPGRRGPPRRVSRAGWPRADRRRRCTSSPCTTCATSGTPSRPAEGCTGRTGSSSRLLSLPLYPRLRDDQVDATCEHRRTPLDGLRTE